MGYHWNSCLGKSVRASLCASSGIGVATGAFQRWRKTQLKSGSWQESQSTAWSLTIHVGIPGQLWSVLGVPDMPRSCCHGEPQGEQLSLRGCSPGKGPAWGREEGAVSQRGWEGLAPAPFPPQCPMGQRCLEWRGGTGKDPWVERCCLSLCLTVRIYFNAIFFSVSNLFCPWE